MTRYNYRHVVTNIESELDDAFVSLFPGAFERVEEKKAAEKTPVETTVEKAPAEAKKTNSSKEGNK